MLNPKDIATDQEVIDILNSPKCSEYWTQLVAHTIKRLIYRYGIKESKQVIKKKSITYVNEIFEIVFYNKSRKWNRVQYPTFIDFLESSVDSHLYNNIVSKKDKVIYDEHIEEKQDQILTNTESDLKQYEETKDKIYNDLVSLGACDEELLIFDCITDNITKPSKICEELGVSKEFFYPHYRRLLSKINKLRPKYQNNE